MQSICNFDSCLRTNRGHGRSMYLSHFIGHLPGFIAIHFVMHAEQKGVSHD